VPPDPHLESLIGRLRDTQALGKLLGIAPAFLDAIRLVPIVAKSDACVLTTGETGTGKELVARAIHYLSPRAPGPFVAVNCGSLPDTLLENELFGHERGAFTDAHDTRPGLLAQAETGTVLLDEVDSLTPRAQVTLLRLLQDGTFRALGSRREQRADVRFLAATNTPLEALVQGGTFRSDLYYRLSVVTIRLPALRHRPEDIPILAAHLLGKHTPEGRHPLRLSPDSEAALRAYAWPGNVRELENVIVRGILLAEGPVIQCNDLAIPAEVPTATAACTYTMEKRTAVGLFEREYTTRLMTEHKGNITHAARAAGMDRRELGRLLKKHRVDRAAFTR
jgi:DNA-binding NtrC family response regulator